MSHQKLAANNYLASATKRKEAPKSRPSSLISFSRNLFGTNAAKAEKIQSCAPHLSSINAFIAASARAASFSFFSFFGTRAGSGGMRPKFTFIGWKFFPS